VVAYCCYCCCEWRQTEQHMCHHRILQGDVVQGITLTLLQACDSRASKEVRCERWSRGTGTRVRPPGPACCCWPPPNRDDRSDLSEAAGSGHTCECDVLGSMRDAAHLACCYHIMLCSMAGPAPAATHLLTPSSTHCCPALSLQQVQLQPGQRVTEATTWTRYRRPVA
jgi:hypothetical protein